MYWGALDDGVTAATLWAGKDCVEYQGGWFPVGQPEAAEKVGGLRRYFLFYLITRNDTRVPVIIEHVELHQLRWLFRVTLAHHQ